jgi:preprotein translocase subunit SecF
MSKAMELGININSPTDAKLTLQNNHIFREEFSSPIIKNQEFYKNKEESNRKSINKAIVQADDKSPQKIKRKPSLDNYLKQKKKSLSNIVQVDPSKGKELINEKEVAVEQKPNERLR